ncbi:MAG: transposase [Bacteriovoracaceae bacterium]|nr:transposase [Bacteriovoracaceae bacterium]
MAKQIDLFTNRGHGGKRTNAGRPRKDKSMQLHVARPDFSSRYPLHVDVKLTKGLPSLRTKIRFKIIKQAIRKARIKGLKIIHFCIQTTHIHLLIESESKQELGTGMQSFCTSIARSLNNALKRRGRVFRDRYYLHVLKTPTEVKNALTYLFLNHAKHTRTPNKFDPFSTLLVFNEKVKLGLSKVNTHSVFPDRHKRDRFKNELTGLLFPPTTWYLSEGWKRAK